MEKGNDIVFYFAVIAIILTLAISAAILPDSSITGQAVKGVTIKNPRLSGTGYSVSFDLELSKDVTKKLAAGTDILTVAATLTDAVNQANGLAQDGLKSLLGLPSLPDAFGILAGIAAWLNNNADACLREIGKNYNGADFKGKYIYSVSKGKGSVIYKDWDYYYATATYFGDKVNCKQKLGCVFSLNRNTKAISKSCFG